MTEQERTKLFLEICDDIIESYKTFVTPPPLDKILMKALVSNVVIKALTHPHAKDIIEDE